MKKFALAAVTTALIGFGHAPVSAQDPDPVAPIPENSLVECGESDGRVDNEDGISVECVDFYVDAESATPTTLAQESTTTEAVTSKPGSLPQTGSGVSSILGIGGALLVGGGIVVVATRRRSTAPAH